MDDTHRGNPFVSPDLWAKSSLLIQFPDVSISALPELGAIPSEWLSNSGIPSQDLGIPKHRNAEADDTELNDSTNRNETLLGLSAEDDTWDLPAEALTNTHRALQRSWEQYADPSFEEPCKFLSEAGIATFDQALRERFPNGTIGRPLKPDIFLKSLFQLGLGRDSALFVYDEGGSFSARMADARMYGLTPECSRSVISRFGQCGLLFRSLRQQIARIYGRNKSPPASVAAAQTISTVLLELVTQVTDKHRIDSLLQLQASFRLPSMTLTFLRDILGGLYRLTTDPNVLTFLFEMAQEVERSEPCLQPLAAYLLAKASEPWLRAVSACIGLRRQDAADEQVRTLLYDHIDLDGDREADEDDLFPKWFGAPDRALLVGTFEGLILLEKQGKFQYTRTATNESMKWHFSWADIIREEQINDRNSCTMDKDTDTVMLLPSTPPESSTPDPYLNSTTAFQEAYNLFEQSQSIPSKPSELQQIMQDILDNYTPNKITSGPSLEAASLKSFRPSLAARARIINRACLQELFTRTSDPRTGWPTSLTYHLSVLRRLTLMGDGMFATRLSHALFDSSLASAERTKGHVRTGKMGLRLGSRSTWPPASSELQLALTGIMASSFETEALPSRPADLPGSISFALRQLSEDEIQRCLDQESLEALDFLRVQYQPPPPLNAVITAPALEKYDAVQKLLLRMTRLVFVVNHARAQRLQSSGRGTGKGGEHGQSMALKFAHAAHHFVTGFTDYLVNTAIGAPWTRFMGSIAELEGAVEQGDTSVTETRGVAYVRSLHDGTLDDILFASLLRKRHEKVRELFEDILRLVLQFVASAADADDGAVLALYARFRKQVGVFINVCKGLAERREYAGGQENGLAGLVTRLTMNDFYSSNVERVLRL